MARHPAGRRDRRGDDAAAAGGGDREGGREGAAVGRAGAARVAARWRGRASWRRRARDSHCASSPSRTCPRAASFEPVDTAADDVAIIAFTSGTTGDAEGLRALPSRPAGAAATRSPSTCSTRARPTSSPARRRWRSRSGSARLVLFPLRFGASMAPVAKPGDLLDAIREHGVTTLFTAPTAYRALLARGRPGLAAHVRQRGRAAARRRCRTPGTRRPASGSSTGSARPRCCTSSSPRRRAEARPGSCGRPGAGLRGADRRRGHAHAAAGRGRQARRARADRLPLPRRPAPVGLRPRRLEPHRRRVLDGRGRLLLVPGAHRRHDHLLRLQHLGLRGRGGAARAPAGHRMRRRRGAGRRARARRDGLRRRLRDRSRRGCCRTTSRR